VARIPFLCLLPVLVSGCEGDRFSEREFWRGDGASDATAALSRGDSQFVLFAFSTTLACLMRGLRKPLVESG
jgi:hypothetical protein